MKKPKSKSKLKQSLKSNIDKIKTKIKPQLTWFSQLLSTENKAKLKTVWLKVDARYAATPKVDKVVIGSAAVLAMGSVAWAAVPASTPAAAAGGAAQVQILELGGNLANKYKNHFGYKLGGKNINGRVIDCSGWTDYINAQTAKAINRLGGGVRVTIPSNGSAEQANYDIGKRHLIWARAKGQSGSSGWPELQPGMLLFQGPGSGKFKGRSLMVGGMPYQINHVQVVVRLAGKIYITDSRNDRDGTTPVLGTDGIGAVNFYSSWQTSSPIARTSSKGWLLTDPLMDVRALLGDKTTTAVDLNTLASGETPGQGEIGGKKGIFGQPDEGDSSAIEDGTYEAEDTGGDSSSGDFAVAGALHDLVMKRVASSAWHRGVTLASEPRLLAELAYMRTIQNIMAKARIASIERREALSASFVGAQAEVVLSDEITKQRAIVTKGGGN